MNNQEDGLLDDLRPARDAFSNLPPAIVSFERVFFIVWNVLTYCCVLIDYSGWLLALMMQFGIGCWQIMSAIICNGIYKTPIRSMYNKLLIGYIVAAFIGCVLLWLINSRGLEVLMLVVGLFAAPQVLNWLYWYVTYTESKIREEMLAQRLELIEEEWQNEQPE